MSQKIIKGTNKLAEAIKTRRTELGLTIEEAAIKAGVGIKSWCRYEAGESIRKDKAKGVCKALNWRVMPGEKDDCDDDFDIKEYQSRKSWSEYISQCFGKTAAISFVIGSDILLDHIEEDIRELSSLPKGTHVGQLPISMTSDLLPEQFLTRYDYEFLYCLRAVIKNLINKAHGGNYFKAKSVMEELALYMIKEESEFLMETLSAEMEEEDNEYAENWKDWIFDLFEDSDILLCLYSGECIQSDNIYHFNYWTEEQFFVN